MNAEQQRLGLIELCARELAEAYDDARLKIDDPVLFLIDSSDSLGQRLCEHYKLADELSILPLPRAEALELLVGTAAAEQAASQMLGSEQALRVIVVAFEGATIEVVGL